MVGRVAQLARSVQDGLGPQAVLWVIPKAVTPREISNELIGDTKVRGDGGGDTAAAAAPSANSNATQQQQQQHQQQTIAMTEMHMP